LAAQVDRLPDGASPKANLRALAAEVSPTVDDMTRLDTEVALAVDEAERRLASLLGLGTADGKAIEGLADKLTVAVAQLEGDLWSVFPSLGKLRLSAVFPDLAVHDQASRLVELERLTGSFISEARRSIHDRLQWWKKEVAPGSKASLLLRASKFYDPGVAKCPVCDLPIASLPVASQLASLRSVDPELSKDLR
jgi:hypothetical protein